MYYCELVYASIFQNKVQELILFFSILEGHLGQHKAFKCMYRMVYQALSHLVGSV